MTDHFTWRGKPLITIGQLSDEIINIETREEAQEFMAAYRLFTPHAAQNVGYLAGYHDHETAARIFEWFQTSHPIFGTYTPTPEEAFKAGQDIVQEAQS